MTVYIICTVRGPEFQTCSATEAIARRKWNEYTQHWVPEAKDKAKERLNYYLCDVPSYTITETRENIPNGAK